MEESNQGQNMTGQRTLRLYAKRLEGIKVINESIIFSCVNDESEKFVWRLLNERESENCSNFCLTFSDFIMICGCMTSYGPGRLYFVKVNGYLQKYASISAIS